MKTKKCSRCEKEKPLDDFAKRTKSFDGYRSTCKQCRYEDRKKWLANGGKELDAKIAREYRKTAKANKARLCRLYGLTSEDWQEMFDDQDGKCLICERHQSELKQTLNVDHCHKTGKVRGLLCGPCNQVLGVMRDDKETVLRMVKYIDDRC